MNSFCAWNSLRMSFCRVPPTVDQSIPRSLAMARYMAQITAAGPLMVWLTVTSPTGMSAYSRCMSSMVLIATPQRPTSPADSGSSESRPIRVGRSNAVDRPVFALVPLAFSRRYLKRRLVSSAEPKPANCRMVQRRLRYMVECTPRVKGNAPGSPIRGCARDGSEGSCVGTADGPYRSSTTYPEMVTVSGSTAGFDGVAAAPGTAVLWGADMARL
jgi:ribosomal protein L36